MLDVKPEKKKKKSCSSEDDIKHMSPKLFTYLKDRVIKVEESTYDYFMNLEFQDMKSLLRGVKMSKNALYYGLLYVTHRRRQNTKMTIVSPIKIAEIVNGEKDPSSIIDPSWYEKDTNTFYPIQKYDHWVLLVTKTSEAGIMGAVFDSRNSSETITQESLDLFEEILKKSNLPQISMIQNKTTPQNDSHSSGIRVIYMAKEILFKLSGPTPDRLDKKMNISYGSQNISDLRSFISTKYSKWLDNIRN